jgi:hypothetical protein
MSRYVNYYPELEYYFNRFVDTYYNLTISKQIRSATADIRQDDLPNNSFFNLLFSNVCDFEYFVYTFNIVPISYFKTKLIRERLHFYNPNYLTIFISSADGTDNPFSIDEEKLMMLELLFNYRKGLPVDLTPINFNNLEAVLSKLIYQYLDIMVNHDFSKLNNTTPLSDPTMFLESFYETYITNEAHRLIIDWNYLVESGLVAIRPQRDTFVKEAGLLLDYVVLTYTPYDDWFMVFKNGLIQDNQLFTFQIVGDEVRMYWSPSFVYNPEDVLIVDYHVKVDPEDAGDQPFDLKIDVGEIIT